jgi:uncharacterized protein
MLPVAMLAAKPAGLLLAPGAGGSADHPVFTALEQRLEPAGLAVERHDFAHRRAGRRSVPKAEAVVGEIVEATEALAARCGVGAEHIVVGGRSYGGRVASMAVAGGMAAAGLVLLSYPLHPPGRPDQSRTAHFGAIAVPVLYVAGDRDPFGRPTEAAPHLQALGGPVTTVWIEGGTHDPRHKGREGAVVDAVAGWLGL